MRSIPGFTPKKSEGGAFAPLPVGGHGVVCRMAYIRQMDNNGREKLVVEFDVAEGPHAGFFEKRHNADAQYANRRWRGTYDVILPTGAGDEKDEWSRKRLGHFIACIEESNPGYKWNWDEKTLRGMRFCAIFRECEWKDHSGTVRTGTECGGVASIKDMISGTVPEIRKRTLKKDDQYGGSSGYYAPAPDEEGLPWDR